ncbi:uncharacterized protein [Pagrus major]|uniref:uncharacterized protein n=1 Tax=Pagrus major TaxID=143350 RepID=UPI003CC849C9
MSFIPHITWIVLTMILRVRAESLAVIVDDPAEFPVNCPMNETAELHREDGTGNPLLVAARRDGVCRPGGGFTDRLDLNSCFAFSRSRYTDSGLYEFTCGSSTDRIQLDVVVASDSSVSEGEAVKLRCYYDTAGGQVEALRWEKDGHMVLEKNLSSGEVRYGTGFEGVRLSPDPGGDWSLMWDHAQLKDEGDYFCSVRSEGVRKARGVPAAARLKVHKRHLVPTTHQPPLNQTQRPPREEKGTGIWTVTGGAVAVFVAGGLAGFGLGWWIKSHRPNVSSGPGGEGPSAHLEMSLVKVENPAGSEDDVGPSRVHC